jgi:phosphonate degradation associated HDIG domain protein
MTDVRTVLDGLYGSSAAREFYDESVSALDHALQCAALATAHGAPGYLVVAALLHDVGHLVADRQPGVDDRHEHVGARFLARWFGPAVTAPIALHVAAKRYLSGADQEYADALSAASMSSLDLQGGAMTAAEQRSFERRPQWDDALRLRRWDDQAKRAGLATPEFASYATLIDDLAGRATRSRAR